MRRPLKTLEEPYRSRAAPPGSSRYWSWLFAAQQRRPALLAIYALCAEWRALADPLGDPAVARVKLAWWRDELQRLQRATPAHPISRFLAQLPGARADVFASLSLSLDAIVAQVDGVPLERAAELAAHSDALLGAPLRIAADLTGGSLDVSAVGATRDWAAGEYGARALRDYQRAARAGRMVFPVDELLAAGVENADLTSTTPPPHLAAYLSTVRERSASSFTQAADGLSPVARNDWRHLLVLAALGRRQLQRNVPYETSTFRLSDLYWAWTAARGG